MMYMEWLWIGIFISCVIIVVACEISRRHRINMQLTMIEARLDTLEDKLEDLDTDIFHNEMATGKLTERVKGLEDREAKRVHCVMSAGDADDRKPTMVYDANEFQDASVIIK